VPEKKKILVFIDWYLPGTNSGGPVRSVSNMVAHLKEDFEFLIITRDTDYCEQEPYKHINTNEWSQIEENCSVFYISEGNINSAYLKKLIENTHYDLAYINGIYSRYFSITPLRILNKLEKPIVVAARGMLNPQAFSVKPFKKKVFTGTARLLGLYKKVVFHATNEQEKEFIKQSFPHSKDVLVAPNLPRSQSVELLSSREKKGITRFVSVARVAREKGTLAALKALSEIKTSAQVVYDIFGPVYDTKYWNECQEVIKKFPSNIAVNYKGSIESEKVPEILKEYHFFLMPSEGENFGHGILEAFTSGCPVIISDNTPWRGLEEKKIGWDVSLSNPEEITGAINMAIEMKQEDYNLWSQNAWEFSREVINDPKVLEANKRLFGIKAIGHKL
jgi:glycosyltransferase involved in cell wall biosynthesis